MTDSLYEFVWPNLGHILAGLGTVLLTVVALVPILSHYARGWFIKRDDIFNSFTPLANQLYLSTFLGQTRSIEQAVEEFSDLYDVRYGRHRLILPTVLFAIVVVVSLFLSLEWAVTRLLVISGTTALRLGAAEHAGLPFLGLPSIGVAGVTGAYLWIATDLVARARRLNLSRADILNATLRLSLSALIGYALAGVAAKALALPIAFAAGAFPLDTVEVLFRRFATKTLNLGMGIEDKSPSQITNLDGIDHLVADRILDADITTIAQLAYCDPVQLCMRTGLAFDYIMDIESQALAWLYFGNRLALLRPAGLRGAMELYDLWEDAQSGIEGVAKDRAQKLVLVAAHMASLDQAAFENACAQAAEDPYTQFLVEVWRDAPVASTTA